MIHTHLAYAGTRENELYMRSHGQSYLDILNSGGGIHKTMNDTESSGEDQIFNETIKRVDESILNGTTYLEIKSVYGKTINGERRLINAIKRIKSIYRNVKITLLAHAVPDNINEYDYAGYFINNMIPAFKNDVDFLDVFCDAAAFSRKSTEMILEAGVSSRLKLKMHADELQNIGCIDLCKRFNFTSVDHLLNTRNDQLNYIKYSGAVATILPVTAFSLDSNYVNAQRFINKKIDVAIASDASPASYNSNMIFAIYLAVRYCNISLENAIKAATINGARSLKIDESTGSIETGKNADLIILDIDDYKKLPYMYMSRLVRYSFINGIKIIDNFNLIH
ncbi:imidazolonepropionase [Picrophilus oshimae]|uniref:imidazolonepropionase n=1 Tax=Picrophilus oshimae TaxID=46632 RepID=UPI00137B1D81|nr:imidazolonepropionase [Picrophilus oshimae]